MIKMKMDMPFFLFPYRSLLIDSPFFYFLFRYIFFVFATDSSTGNGVIVMFILLVLIIALFLCLFHCLFHCLFLCLFLCITGASDKNLGNLGQP
jgi:hypothetical protein